MLEDDLPKDTYLVKLALSITTKASEAETNPSTKCHLATMSLSAANMDTSQETILERGIKPRERPHVLPQYTVTQRIEHKWSFSKEPCASMRICGRCQTLVQINASITRIC